MTDLPACGEVNSGRVVCQHCGAHYVWVWNATYKVGYWHRLAESGYIWVNLLAISSCAILEMHRLNKSFFVYRNGWSGDLGKLPDALEATVARFAEAFGALPKSAIVNPTAVDVARATLAGLGLAFEVEAVGGCLLGEIWLQKPEGVAR